MGSDRVDQRDVGSDIAVAVVKMKLQNGVGAKSNSKEDSKPSPEAIAFEMGEKASRRNHI